MGAPELPDQELVTRCRRDADELHASFRLLYDRHAPGAYRFLKGWVGPEAALDCLQETFLRVFRDLDRFDPARPFQPWVLGIARNVATNSRRDHARRKTTQLPAVELPAQPRRPEAERREERALFREALAELPEEEREVFLLRKTEGLQFEQVAAVTGCSVRTAKHRMRSALTLLALGLRRRGLVGGGAV